MTHSGEYYHVLNRGNEKQRLFIEEENYLFFMKRLKKYLSQGKQELIAYCLMPNHFHLLVKETIENSLQKTMLGLQTSYAKAINKRYQRTGHLFQDTYHKIRIESNEQLLHLSRYIHLNPVKAGLVLHPEKWYYSSYLDYIRKRNGTLPNKNVILSQFRDNDEYKAFVMDHLKDMTLGNLTLE